MTSFIGSHVVQFSHYPIETNKQSFTGFICNGHLHTVSSGQKTRITSQR